MAPNKTPKLKLALFVGKPRLNEFAHGLIKEGETSSALPKRRPSRPKGSERTETARSDSKKIEKLSVCLVSPIRHPKPHLIFKEKGVVVSALVAY